MPIDYSADAHLILVRNRAGISLPFSTGLLATSILVTGIETPLAYEIAAQIADSLKSGRDHELSADELAERTATALAARAGNEAAERYRNWRAAKQHGRPLVLCLSGAPGVGKSTIGTRLACRLGIHRVVPTDAIREVLRTVIPEPILPELHLAAHEAAQRDEAASASSSFRRQAQAVSAAAAAVADRMVREGRSVMVEGAHLLPGEVRTQLARRGCGALVLEVLLTLDDESLHRAYMLRRTRSDAARPGARHLENFAAIRDLQEVLRGLARDAGVMWHDLANPDGLTEWIVDHVVAATGNVVPAASN
jgi:2-phosphoglycerate kinase